LYQIDFALSRGFDKFFQQKLRQNKILILGYTYGKIKQKERYG